MVRTIEKELLPEVPSPSISPLKIVVFVCQFRLAIPGFPVLGKPPNTSTPLGIEKAIDLSESLHEEQEVGV